MNRNFQKQNIRKVGRYDPSLIETKWQQKWKDSNLYKTDTVVKGKENFYSLTMLPYPSGDLHVGHWYAMTPADAYTRFKRLQGFNVMHPQGFDAFGLPAENAAIKSNIHPYKWTRRNIKNMLRQFVLMGNSYDWSRTAISCEPQYYRWNQYFFLKFYENGLAYRKLAEANWCPSCVTTLANEQVNNGSCERCSTLVIRKTMKQWFFKITKYADELLDFKQLTWPEKIVLMQVNWIGKSDGLQIQFPVSDSNLAIEIFTTRIDTIFGATFVVLAPEHPLVEMIVSNDRKEQVFDYLRSAQSKTNLERQEVSKGKGGIFTGAYATNLANNQKLPIFVADYVLMGYGTGAIMGVAAHDQRDFDFAKNFNLEIVPVIQPQTGLIDNVTKGAIKEAWTGDGKLINSGMFNNLNSEDAKFEMSKWAIKESWGKPVTVYRMRDWLISRQRYWGTPIPIIYCSKCGELPVPYEQLPVLLPEDSEFLPTGQSPLLTDKKFLETKCHKCNSPAKRETDTMDTFVDSAWYHIRFLNPEVHDAPFSSEEVSKWMPVNTYMGGAEHAVMHLLYARFFNKALRDLGLLDFDEPYLKLFNQGVMTTEDGKISKRSNPLNPEPLVQQYGTDAVRGYLMFIGPWKQGGVWTEKGINGIVRWLNRFWEMTQRELIFDFSHNSDSDDKQLEKEINRFAYEMETYYEEFKFNLVISSLMSLSTKLNHFWQMKTVSKKCWQKGVRYMILAASPIFPHITEEIWQLLGNVDSVHLQKYPQWDKKYLTDEVSVIAIQVNGKLRETITASKDIDKTSLESQIKNAPKVGKYLAGKTILKVVYVPNKVLNFVVK